MLGGLLAIAVKGLVIPLVLGSVLRRSTVRREAHLFLGRQASILAAVAIVFIAATAMNGAIPSTSLAASASV